MPELVSPIIPTAPSGASDSFLKGFSAMAAIAARKQEADRQAKLELQKIALQNNQNAVRAQHYSDMAETANGRLAVAQDRLAYDQKKDFETTDAEQKMIRELSAIKAPAGTGAYDSARLEVMSRYPEALRGVQGRKFLFDTAKDHDSQLKVRQGLFNAEVQKLRIPFDAFENPQIWKKREDGKSFIELPAQTAAGVPIVDGEGKQKTDFVTINDDTLKRLNERYHDLYGRNAPLRQEPKALDAQTASQFLQQAGGDKVRARQLATEQGYTF